MDYMFVKGLDVAEALYHEGVKLVMAQHFPKLRYSAARLGGGSDTLGFDTPTSMDHDWQPMLEVYLSAEDYETYSEKISGVMRHGLPRRVAGIPTNFSSSDWSNSRPIYAENEPIEHRVFCVNVDAFVVSHRPFNPNHNGVTALDWLTIPQQNLRLIKSGRIFHDGLGELESIRQKLRYYPDDVWYYMLAAQWERIDQESPFMGRCGDVGDELGSRVLAARLIHFAMDLCFLMERQYAPYSKWFGSAFAQLRCAAKVTPMFHGALDAQTWQERETHLSQVYECLAGMHNALGITEPVPTQVQQFHERPYLVPADSNPGDRIYEKITSEEVRRLPKYLGSLDQISNVVCLRDWPGRRAKTTALYATEGTPRRTLGL